MTMTAFHGDPAIKAKYISRVEAHRAADQLIRGTGWKDGRGCAVGCTLDGYDHSRYPTELGIPIVLAYLEDRLFERMPIERSMQWPSEFLSAAEPGADLSLVWPRFASWVLRDIADTCKIKRSKKVCIETAALFDRQISGKPPTIAEWRIQRDAAGFGGDAAAYAAAYAAAGFAAEAAYAYAAYAHAAASAASAAHAASAAAYAAGGVGVGGFGAKSKYFVKMADKLLELMREAPVIS